MDVWHDLQALLRNPKIDADVTMAFGTLWELVECRPNLLTITSRQLAERLGSEPHDVPGWILRLSSWGSSWWDAICRTAGRGTCTLTCTGLPGAGHRLIGARRLRLLSTLKPALLAEHN